MSQSTKRTLITEIPSGDYPSEEAFQKNDRSLLTDAVKETNDKRKTALQNAKDAVAEAFGSKIGDVITEKNISEFPSKIELEELMDEVDAEFSKHDPAVIEYRKKLNEAKNMDLLPSDKDEMYRDIHRKFWAYAKSVGTSKVEVTVESDTDKAIKNFLTNQSSPLVTWLSHEGSTIVCALISVSSAGSTTVNMSQLPENDRILVNSAVQKITGKPYEGKALLAKFDDFKNFIFETRNSNSKNDVCFTFGNRVSSIPPNESSRFGSSDVKVERKGKDVVIGDRIIVDKSKLQTLAQTYNEPQSNGRDWSKEKKPKVSGRNAYEIRADVLEMALDWIKYKNEPSSDEEEVLRIAEFFYEFVEQK
jgi:hypothetical protein